MECRRALGRRTEGFESGKTLEKAGKRLIRHEQPCGFDEIQIGFGMRVRQAIAAGNKRRNVVVTITKDTPTV